MRKPKPRPSMGTSSHGKSAISRHDEDGMNTIIAKDRAKQKLIKKLNRAGEEYENRKRRIQEGREV